MGPSQVVAALACSLAVGCAVVSGLDNFDLASTMGGGGNGGSGGESGTTNSGMGGNFVTSSNGSGGAGGSGGAAQGGGGSGGATTTTSTGTSGGTLDCGGGLTCPLGMDSACCWYTIQDVGSCIQGPPDPTTCNTFPQNGGYGARIECQLPSDCPQGTVCCGNRVPISGNLAYYSTVTCEAQCPPEDRILCNSMAPGCPQGVDCVQSQILPPGYFVCSQL
jgi:hypothetical protein